MNTTGCASAGENVLQRFRPKLRKVCRRPDHPYFIIKFGNVSKLNIHFPRWEALSHIHQELGPAREDTNKKCAHSKGRCLSEPSRQRPVPGSLQQSVPRRRTQAGSVLSSSHRGSHLTSHPPRGGHTVLTIQIRHSVFISDMPMVTKSEFRSWESGPALRRSPGLHT